MPQRDPAYCAASRDGENLPHEYNEDTSANRQRGERTSPAMNNDDRTDRMTRLDGGTFSMGTNEDIGFPADGEGPARDVMVDSFYIDRFAVTNAEFLQFVRDTGYTTDAERFGWSFVFEDFLTSRDESHVIQRVADAPWWVSVEGANWLRPEGPSSNIIGEERLKHPVTHVSWNDAHVYLDLATLSYAR